MIPEILNEIKTLLVETNDYKFNTYNDFPENFELEYIGDTSPKHVIMFNLDDDFEDLTDIPYIVGIEKNTDLKDFEQARIELMMTAVIDDAIVKLNSSK